MQNNRYIIHKTKIPEAFASGIFVFNYEWIRFQFFDATFGVLHIDCPVF